MNKRETFIFASTNNFIWSNNFSGRTASEFFFKGNTAVCVADRVTFGKSPRDSGESPVQNQSSLSLLPRVNLSNTQSARPPWGNLILSTLVRWSPSSLMNSSCWSKWRISRKWHRWVSLLLVARWCRLSRLWLMLFSSCRVFCMAWRLLSSSWVLGILMLRKEMRLLCRFSRNIRLLALLLCSWEQSRNWVICFKATLWWWCREQALARHWKDLWSSRAASLSTAASHSLW